MIFPHALVVYPSELTADADGNPVRRPGAGVPAVGYVQARDASETTTDGQSSSSRWVVFLEATTPFLDAYSEVEWAGLLFETVGQALWFADPDGCVSYWRATLRRTGS